MRDVIAAEWIKMRSLRSTRWTLAGTTSAVVGSAVADAYTSPPENGFQLSDAFPVAGFLVLIVAATAFGSAAMLGEYGSGLIRATSVAVPARAEVVLAKAAVIAAVWTVAGTVMAASSFTVTGLILGDVTLSRPGTGAALLAAILIGPVCALTGLALAVLVRHAGAVYVAGILLLVLAPQMVGTRQEPSRMINHAMLLPAWQRLTQAYGSPEAVGDIYATATTAWLVYALWPLILLAAAVSVHRRRDV
ncbi:ABC transporter permease [Actinoplanes sp. OR16]|uniref:ABC transporter permease subunit n=1 Tax=Actinoplanes sp. OR16 TaxID=946334 RepID=UPI000F6C7DDE|nr:ABC transporter permease subunit [Actinoplanes sp. OR16]BBH69509.1 ABC transporter permease [Actinoplanes sp. OR16]